MNQVVEKQLSEVEAKKYAAWGNLGLAVHETEMKLQAMAQGAIAKLKYPSKIEEVEEAELMIKAVKKEQATIEKERKEITSRFDDVSSRLMLPAKSINEPLTKSEAACIKIKSEYAKIQAAKQQKADEIKSIREKIASYLSNADAEAKSTIAISVTAAYEHALTKGDIKPDAIKEFVLKCYSRITEENFRLQAPNIQLKLVQPEEMNLILDEEFHFDANKYVQLYQDELDRKFDDYAVAYANKVEALELSKRQEKEKQDQIKAEKEQADLAASIAVNSEPINATASDAGPVVKALKRSYEVNMLETPENAIAIIGAFVANFQLCNAKLKVSKWFSITPTQMAAALSKVKCDDNNFQPAGIIFKEVEKL